MAFGEYNPLLARGFCRKHVEEKNDAKCGILLPEVAVPDTASGPAMMIKVDPKGLSSI